MVKWSIKPKGFPGSKSITIFSKFIAIHTAETVRQQEVQYNITSGHRILSRVDFITQTITSLLRILYKEQKEGGNTLKQYIRQDRLSHKSNIRLDIIRYKRATHNNNILLKILYRLIKNINFRFILINYYFIEID